jgi:hypothetical protein
MSSWTMTTAKPSISAEQLKNDNSQNHLVLLSSWTMTTAKIFQGYRSKVNVTGSNFYCITSLWTLYNQHPSMDVDQTWYRFQTLVRTKCVPSLVKIHWRMLILECSQGCYAVKIWPLDRWPWKSIGFQTLLRTMYVPSLVKIHWRMLILECSLQLLNRNSYPLANEVAMGYSNATVHLSVTSLWTL